MKPLILSDDEFDKLPDASESSMVLSDEDFDKLPDAPDTEEISQTESAIRGAAQEASFGLADELTGIAETGLETIKGNVPLSPSELLKTYQKLRDESRAAYKASEEANPKSYFGGQIAGGIGSGILTGGTGVAGKLAAGAATKAGIGQLMKEGAKSGFKYGLGQGFGKSEAEIAKGEFGQLGKDIAVEGGLGLAAGGAMPLAVPLAKGAASTIKKAAKAVGGLVKKVPGYDKAVTSYNWGKLGRDLTMEEADTQMVKLSQEVLKNIKDSKGSVDFKKLKEALEQNNIVVDTMEDLTSAIQDLLKISQADVYKTSKASQIVPVLQELSGSDPAAKKLLDQLEKRIAKQATEAASKAEQAVIKGEKKVFDQALKSGDDIDSITNLNRSFDDIAEIPTDTTQGTIGGVKANLKRTVVDPETGEDVVESINKMVTGDVTPYQPTAPSMTIDPTTGRQVAVTKDLGSGKITALVGEAVTDPAFDASKVPVGKLDEFIAVSNNFIKLAETQGNTNDPAVQRLQKLLGDLRRKSNKVIEESGVSPEIIAGRKKYTNLSEAERLLGIDDAQSILKPVDEQLKIGTIGEKLGYEKGFKDRIERDVTEELLSDTVKPETLKEFELLREVNKLVGRTGEKTANDTVSKSGLWTQLMTKGANVAGQGRASIDKSMRDLGTAITNSTPVEIQNMATMLKMSSNKAAQTFAPMVEQAIGQDGKVRKAALFALYQQPAFREVIKQMANVEGVAQKAAEEYNPPSNPRSPQNSSTFNIPTETEEEETPTQENLQSSTSSTTRDLLEKFRSISNAIIPEAAAADSPIPMNNKDVFPTSLFSQNNTTIPLRPDSQFIQDNINFNSMEKDLQSNIQDDGGLPVNIEGFKDFTGFKGRDFKGNDIDINENYESIGSGKNVGLSKRNIPLNLGNIDATLSGAAGELGHSKKTFTEMDMFTGEKRTQTGSRNLGFDFVSEDNDPKIEGIQTKSAWPGEVVLSGKDPHSKGHGETVIVKHNDTVTINGEEYDVFSAYGHNSKNLVKVGQQVDDKTSIATMGGSTYKKDKLVQGAYPNHVDMRSFIVPKGGEWNIKDKVYINPKQLERLNITKLLQKVKPNNEA